MNALLDTNLISTKEAGELSGYTADYLARLARSGKITSRRIGRAWLIDKASLESFMTEQGNRNVDRARALARAREEEYRAAQSALHTTRTLTIKAPVPPIRLASSRLRTHALAFAVAIAVVSGGAMFAHAEALTTLGTRTLALANEAAFGFAAAFGYVPARVAENIQRVGDSIAPSGERVRNEIAYGTALVAPKELAAPDLSFARMNLGSPRMAPLPRAPAYVAAHFAPITFADIADSARAAAAFVSSPRAVFEALGAAYRTAGNAGYAAIRAMQNAYLALVERAGAESLALGVNARDLLAESPRAIAAMNFALGDSVVRASHAAIGAEVALVYGSVRAAPVVAETSVALIGGAGNTLAGATFAVARGSVNAAIALAVAPRTLAPAFVNAVWGAEYQGALALVSASRAAAAAYFALLEGAGRAAYSGTHAAIALMRAATPATPPSLTITPRAVQDWFLGTLGKTAVAFDTFGTRFAETRYGAPIASGLAAAVQASQPALSLGEQAALSTYETIHGWFSDAAGALAILFAPPATIVLPSALPQLHSATTTPSALPLRAVAVTSYPTYTTLVQGASQNYVDMRISALNDALQQRIADLVRPVAQQVATNITTIQEVNMIQHLDSLDLTNPTISNARISGSTFGGDSVGATNATFTNATTTALVTTGDTTVGGNLTVNGIFAPAGISSGGAVSAPYFTATSTATSTFAGALAVGTSTPAATGLFTVGTSSPLLTVDSNTGNIALGHFTQGSVPYFGASGLLSQDNGNFFYDGTNHRLGIGSTSPFARLSIFAGGDYAAHALSTLFAIGSTTAGIATTTLFSIDSAGNIAANNASATTTIAGGFAVGLCVTGDTKLRRRRRRKDGEEPDPEKGETADDDYLYDEVAIKDIQEGDEIQSLDEKTGVLVWRRVKRLAFMGTKQTFRLTTASGRAIRTTANHPYLTDYGWKKVSELSEGMQVAVPRARGPRTYAFVDAANIVYRSADENGWKIDMRKLLTYLQTRYGASEVFYYAGVDNQDAAQAGLYAAMERWGYRLRLNPVKRFVNARGERYAKADVDARMAFEAMRYAGEYDRAVFLTGDGDFYWLLEHLVSVKDVRLIASPAKTARELKKLFGAAFVDLGSLRTVLTFDPEASKQGEKSATDTVKVSVAGLTEPSYAFPGTASTGSGDIAYERIASVEPVAEEEVWDVEIEGTHNFIGNGIVAHNTAFVVNQGAPANSLYINPAGNVGIGTAGPTAKLEVNGTFTSDSTTILGGLTGGVALDGTAISNSSMYVRNGVGLWSGSIFGWSSNADPSGTKDIALSRGAAGKLYVGNGSSGYDYSGTLIAGNVGIGTNTPITPLNIVVSTSNNNDLIQGQNSNAAGYSAIGFRDNSGTFQTEFGYGNASVSNAAEAGSPYIYTNTGKSLNFVNGTTLVGQIGLAGSPSNGILKLFGPSTGSGSGSFYYDGPDSNNAAYAAFGIATAGSFFGTTGATVFSSGKNGTGTQLPMVFGGFNGSWSSWMTLTTNGNVGVGTTSPYKLLTVGGDAVIGAATAGGTNGNLYLNGLAAPAGALLAADASGKVIATSTISAGVIGDTLGVAHGGTGQSTFASSQLLYGAGTGALQSVATTSATLGLGLSGALTTLNNVAQSLSIATSSLYTGATNAIPYFSGTNTLGSIPAGTNSYVLAMSGGVPTWVATSTLTTISGILPVAHGGTGVDASAYSGIFGLNNGTVYNAATTTFGNGLSYSAGAAGLSSIAANSVLGTYAAGVPSAIATSSLFVWNGTGNVVRDTGSTISLTSATGLPISTGVTGLGTGVATALGVSVGTAGAFVTNGGALGTPSSGTLTNATGLLPSGMNLTKGNFLVGNDSGVAQATSTIFISSTGNVGVGTTSPYAQLSLGGGNLVLGAASAGGTNGNLYLNGLAAPAGALLAADASGKVIATSTIGVSSLGLALPKGNFLVGSNSGVAQATSTIFISSTGNVGIGTTPTTHSLELSTIGYSQLITNNLGGGSISVGGAGINMQTGGNGIYANGNYLYWPTGTAGWGLLNASNNYALFASAANQYVEIGNISGGSGGNNPTPGTSSLMVIGTTTTSSASALNVTDSNKSSLLLVQNNGSVGIGSTSPWAALSVMAGNDYASHAASTLFAIGSSTAGTATSTLFSVNSSGATNISGTITTPLLTITNNSYSSQSTVVGLNGIGMSLNANYPGFGTNAYYNSNAGGTGWFAIGSGYTGSFQGDPVHGGFGFTTGGNVSAGGSVTMTARMEITDAGIVGIGYTADQGGGQKLQVNSGAYFNGNVGIGTTSPYAQLSLGGGNLVLGAATAGGTNGNLYLNGLAAPAGALLAADASGKVIATSTISAGVIGDTLGVAHGGTGQSSFTSSNLLYGAGTGALQSVATTSATLGLGLSGALTTLNNAAQSLTIATSSLFTGTAGQTAYFNGTNSLVGTSTLFISTAGNVGIGTTSPYAQLSLGGGNLVLGAATAGGTLGDLFLPKLGAAEGTFLAADATGKIIATTTNYLVTTQTILNYGAVCGGTGESSANQTADINAAIAMLAATNVAIYPANVSGCAISSSVVIGAGQTAEGYGVAHVFIKSGSGGFAITGSGGKVDGFIINKNGSAGSAVGATGGIDRPVITNNTTTGNSASGGNDFAVCGDCGGAPANTLLTNAYVANNYADYSGGSTGGLAPFFFESAKNFVADHNRTFDDTAFGFETFYSSGTFNGGDITRVNYGSASATGGATRTYTVTYPVGRCGFTDANRPVAKQSSNPSGSWYVSGCSSSGTTVTLSNIPLAYQSDTITLNAFRSAEGILINSGSQNVAVNGVNIDGTGDNGITVGADKHCSGTVSNLQCVGGTWSNGSAVAADEPTKISVNNVSIRHTLDAGIAFNLSTGGNLGCPQLTVTNFNISDFGLGDSVSPNFNAAIGSGWSGGTACVLNVGPGTVDNTSGSGQYAVAINGTLTSSPNILPLTIIDNGTTPLASETFVNTANGYSTGLNTLTGNVGIGTSSPQELLHISGLSPGIRLDDTSGNGSSRNWMLRTNDLAYGDFSILQSNAATGNPRTAGTRVFYINPSGDIGINMTGPEFALGIAGSAPYTGYYTGSGGSTSRRGIIGTSPSSGSLIAGDTTGDIGIRSEGGAINFSANSGTSRQMVLTTGGLVGIGTTGPLSKLDVNGGLAVGTYAGTSAAPSNGMIVSGNVGIGTTSPYAQLSVSTTTANYTGQTLFAIGNSSNSTLFNVLGNGNVGLGTASPTEAKLVVNGPAEFGSVGATSDLSGYSSGIDIGGTADAAAHMSFIRFGDNANSNSRDWAFVNGRNAPGQFDLRVSSAANGDPVSGTLILTATTGGLVGVGTTSPYAQLSVSTTTANYTGQTLFAIGNSSNSTLFNVLGNGNVGLGTASPNIGAYGGTSPTVLTLSSAAATGDLELATGRAVGNSTVIGDVAFEDSNLTSTVRAASIRATMMGTAANDAGGQLDFNTKANGGTFATAMTITNTQSVGIGTTTPDQLLSLYGATTPSIELSSASGPTNKWTFGIDTADQNKFKIASSTAVGTNTRLTIDGAGNVGLGTASPAFNLSLDGTAITTSVGFYNSTTRNGIIGTVGTAGSGVTGSGVGDLFVRNEGHNMLFSTDSGGSAQLYLKNGGNVGLGTTSPYAQLSLGGGNLVLGAATAGGTNGILYLNGLAAPAGALLAADASGKVIATSTIGVSSLGLALPKGNFLVGNDSGVAQATSTIFISSTGHVGIGTTGGRGIFTVNSTNATDVLDVGDVANSNPYSGYNFPMQVVGTLANGNDGLAGFDNNQTTSRAQFVMSNSGSGSWTGNFMSFMVHGSAYASHNYLSGATDAGLALINVQGSDVTKFGIGTATAIPLALYTNNLERLSITSTGNVGIGTTTPDQKLSIYSATTPSLEFSLGAGTGNQWTTGIDTGNGNAFEIASSSALGTNPRLVINGAGNVGLGTTSPVSTLSIQGSLCVRNTGSCGTTAGTIYATTNTITGIDLAENYPTADASLSAGEIVAFDTSNPTFVKRASESSASYLGVVSTAPGVLLGNQVTNAMPIALAGRVPVRVNMDGGPIAMGDAITVSSSTPGVGAKASISGQTIGIALENATAPGTIEVFIKPEYTFAPGQFTVNAATGNVGIGTNDPQHTLQVAGEVGAYGFVNTSTRAAKTDIQYLTPDEASTTLAELETLKPATYIYKNDPTAEPRFGIIAEDAAATAPEVLSADGKGVDLYKLATFTLSGVQVLAARQDTIAAEVGDLETRVKKLEDGSITVASGSPISFSASALTNALADLGIIVQKGIAQFNTLVFNRLVAATDASGTSAAGSGTILAGNTVADISNAQVLPSTKVFVTFNAQVAGDWWVSDKSNGSFRVVLSAPQAGDVSFDYFLVQTSGQIATSSPESNVSSQGSGNSGLMTHDSGLPVITLLGDNPVHVSVGGTYAEPGLSITDSVDGNISIYQTFVNGVQFMGDLSTLDTSAPITYVVTYEATDRAGNSSTARRSVIVGNPDGIVNLGAATTASTTTSTDAASSSTTSTGSGQVTSTDSTSSPQASSGQVASTSSGATATATTASSTPAATASSTPSSSDTATTSPQTAQSTAPAVSSGTVGASLGTASSAADSSTASSTPAATASSTPAH